MYHYTWRPSNENKRAGIMNVLAIIPACGGSKGIKEESDHVSMASPYAKVMKIMKAERTLVLLHPDNIQ